MDGHDGILIVINILKFLLLYRNPDDGFGLRTMVQLHGTMVSSAIDPPQRSTIESVVIT